MTKIQSSSTNLLVPNIVYLQYIKCLPTLKDISVVHYYNIYNFISQDGHAVMHAKAVTLAVSEVWTVQEHA